MRNSKRYHHVIGLITFFGQFFSLVLVARMHKVPLNNPEKSKRFRGKRKKAVDIIEGEKNSSSGSYERYLSAELALKRGNLGKSARLFKELSETKAAKQSVPGHLRLLHKQRKFDEIITHDGTLKDNREVQLIIAEAYLNLKQVDKAQKILRELLEKDPTDAHVAYHLAMLHALAKQFEEALAVLDSFLTQAKLTASHHVFYVLQAKIYVHVGKLSLAYQAASEAVALSSKSAEGWFLQGAIAEKLGNLKGAIESYKHLATLLGRKTGIVQHLIHLLFAQKRFREAKEILQSIPEDTAEHFFDLALIGWRAGQAEEALRSIDMALAKNLYLPNAKRLKIEVLLSLKRVDAVLKTIRQWLLNDPTDGKSLRLLLALKKAGISQRARLNTLLSVQKKVGDNQRILAGLVDLYSEKKQYTNAIFWCRRMVSFVHDEGAQSRILAQIGHFFLAMKQLRKAIDALQQATSLKRVYPAAYNLLACAYLEGNRSLAKSMQIINRALRFQPQNPLFLDTKGMILLKKGDRLGARSYFEKALQKAPNDTLIKRHLAQAQ